MQEEWGQEKSKSHAPLVRLDAVLVEHGVDAAVAVHGAHGGRVEQAVAAGALLPLAVDRVADGRAGRLGGHERARGFEYDVVVFTRPDGVLFADVDARDRSGNGAVHLATHYEREENAALIGKFLRLREAQAAAETERKRVEEEEKAAAEAARLEAEAAAEAERKRRHEGGSPPLASSPHGEGQQQQQQQQHEVVVVVVEVVE